VGQLVLVTGDQHEAEDLVQREMTRAAAHSSTFYAHDRGPGMVRRVAFNLAVAAPRQPAQALWRCLAATGRRGAPGLEERCRRRTGVRSVPVVRPARLRHHLRDLPVKQLAHAIGARSVSLNASGHDIER
jgi:hypothetical protein